MWTTYVLLIFKYRAKINTRPLGENSPNRVTLLPVYI
jgi:hypothetical protein